MSSVATEELIKRAGRALIDAAPVPAKVIRSARTLAAMLTRAAILTSS